MSKLLKILSRGCIATWSLEGILVQIEQGEGAA